MGSIIATDNHKDNEESGATALGGEEPEEPETPPTAWGYSNFPGGGATEVWFPGGGENFRSEQERDPDVIFDCQSRYHWQTIK